MLQIVAYFVAYWRTLSSGKWQWLRLQVKRMDWAAGGWGKS